MYKLLLGSVLALALTGCGATPEAKNAIAAAESGDPDAQMKLAVAYASPTDSPDHIPGIDQDEKKTTEWYTKAAEKGNSSAQVVLGLRYSFGSGVPIDYNKSLYWFSRAKAYGNPRGQECIDALRGAIDSPARTDAEKAAIRAAFEEETKTTLDLIKKAEAGDMIACLRAGGRLHDGVGVKPDLAKSNHFYLYVAEHGNVSAQLFIGNAYMVGSGIEQNYAEGLKWLRISADLKNPDAAFGLAVAYTQGLGVDANEMEAMKWVKIAAAEGHREAKRMTVRSPQRRCNLQRRGARKRELSHHRDGRSPVPGTITNGVRQADGHVCL